MPAAVRRPRVTLQGVSEKCAKCAHFLYGRESKSWHTPPFPHTNDFCGKHFLADEPENTKSPPKHPRRVYEEVGFEDQGGEWERHPGALEHSSNPLRPPGRARITVPYLIDQ